MIDQLSLGIGFAIGLGLWLIVYIIKKIFIKKEKKEKVSLSGMKGFLKSAYDNMVEANNRLIDSTNNIIKVYEVFNEIEGK